MNTACKPVRKEHLNNAISISYHEGPLDFQRAKALAFDIARRKSPEPMLLAWFDKARGKYSPPVECCGEDKPSWLVYAESRGGDLVVEINDMDYVFVFHDSSSF